jgi:hypothetical protein
LFEVGPKVVDLLIVLDAGESHFRARDFSLGILDVFLEGRLIPDDARILVGIGILVIRDATGFAAVQAILCRTDLVLRARTDASFALVAATIIVPLRPTVREAGWQLAVGGTIYFALIGVGFMMVEIALLQRMSVFLGHPVYALSVVLFSLILWTGFGSMTSKRVRLDGAGKLVAWSVASAAYLFALPVWLPLLFDLDGANILVRASLCVLVLAPAGFLMGFGFPTGMRLVSTINAGPMPWFWGINGGAGVLAASIAVVTSVAVSIDATLRVGAACYLLVAAPAVLLASIRSRPSSTATIPAP